MKKLLFTSFLVFGVTYASADELYKGCGINEDEARLNLASNISVKIESSTFLEKKDSSFFGLESFTKSFTKTSKQSTSLSLKEVKIQSEKNKVCATIQKDKLISLTKTLISKVDSYSKSSLPLYEKKKVVKLNDILIEIKNTIVLVEVLSDEFSSSTLNALEKKQKYFMNLRSKYNSQFAKITILGNHANLSIDDKKVTQNKEIFLKSGNHKYIINSKNHCKVEGKFTLEKNNDFETVVNMNDYNFPFMIIDSNKKDAKLLINGKKHPLGVKYISKVCDDSVLPYTISYGKSDKETDTLSLSPNETLEKNYTFYSNKELNSFSKSANNYKNKKRLEIKYGYMAVSTSDEYKDYENLHTIQINYLKSYKSLRYGPGALYGESSTSSEIEGYKSTAYEVYYNIGFELATFSNNKALHLGSIVVIPSLSGQFGVGYHELYNDITVTTIDKFDGTNDNLWQNNGIAKVNLGLDFILNENIAFNIFLQKQFTMEKSTTFGSGLVVLF